MAEVGGIEAAGTVPAHVSDHAHRLLAQHPVGEAIVIPIERAAERVCRFRSHSRQLQRHRVGDGDVSAVAIEDDGVLVGGSVQHLPSGEPALGEALVVETDTHQRVAGRDALGGCGDPLDEIVEVGRVLHDQTLQRPRVAGGVHVRVAQPRDDGAARETVFGKTRPAEVVGRADRRNGPVADHDGIAGCARTDDPIGDQKAFPHRISS